MSRKHAIIFEGLEYRTTPNGGVIVDAKSLLREVRRKRLARTRDQVVSQPATSPTVESA